MKAVVSFSVALLLALVFAPRAARGQAVAPPTAPAVPPKAEKKIKPSEDRRFEITGYYRARFNVFENFDLNRGPTPTTGRTIFPLSTANPNDALTGGNMRLRLEPVLRMGWGVAIYARIDLLDNVVFGSTPEGLPQAIPAPLSGGSVQMNPPESGKNALVDSIRVQRAWGEVMLPFGVLSVGRMGALIDWGTGFFINSGNCIDCDRGDVGDRVSFVTALFDHAVAFAFDFGASGPTSASLRLFDPQPFDLDQRDNVLSWALIIAKYNSPEVVDRYLRAGRWVFQYGVVASFRRQEYDVPSYYLTGNLEREYTGADTVKRGLFAFVTDVWFGVRYKGLTLDFEMAVLHASVDNASLLPGVETREPITGTQWGGVFRASYRFPKLEFGLELGVASGDSAPGFGYRAPLNQLSSQPGDLDGPQINIPGDTNVNNFRFNSDYRIDLILWRRIIGTVTDAFYTRGRVAYQPLKDLWLEAVVIGSSALQAESTPSGDKGLGVELDLMARYKLDLGFEALLGYGVLFPLSGLRNVRYDLDPEPAHTLHVVLAFRVQ
jgi:uncharacterized protein (TIGR04551 family)